MIDNTGKVSGKRVERECKGCGESFLALAIKVRRGKGKYCSAECYNLSRHTSKKKNKYSTEKSHQLKHKYGITLEDFKRMKAAQGNCCAICQKEFCKTPFVDHCHETQNIRGLLCSNCNTGLGMFCDNIEILKNAIKYLSDCSSVG